MKIDGKELAKAMMQRKKNEMAVADAGEDMVKTMESPHAYMSDFISAVHDRDCEKAHGMFMDMLKMKKED